MNKQKVKTESGTTIGVGALINGRYRLDAEVGRGGMGIVFRAHDLIDKRDVSIKIINVDQANALTRQQFIQEAEISSQFNHPHIVRVYAIGTVDSGADEPLPFIVMELVSGTSLADMHSLTYARIIDIGIQMCEALEYAHNQGFAYRDLKPGNVLIEKRGFEYFVKLVDFGLARPRGKAYLDRESSLAGSFFYLAPELIAGQPADVGSDLYALGVTLYEMITGRVPFSDFDEKTILSQHLEASVTRPSQSRLDVPLPLEAVVLRLMAKDPGDRFASAREVREALRQIAVVLKSSVRTGNLSQGSSEIIGHENEVDEAKRLLRSNRMITILSDDEKLALAIGTQLADQFLDGAWWVDLKSVNEPSSVLPTVCSVLGIHQDVHRSLTVALLENVREKNLLLLLYHCDHLLGACAQLAETILSNCPDAYILATSNQPLGLSAEKSYPTKL